jgi:hypothetical protein
VLYVPLAAANTTTEFEVDYGTSTTLDLSPTTITAHVYVQTATTGGGLRLYAKNDSITTYAVQYSTWQNLSDLKGAWHDIALDLSAVAVGPNPPVAGTFDKSIVRWIGFNISAGATGTFAPATVYVDSIKFTPVDSPAVTDDFTFATTAQGFGLNSGITNVAGSTVIQVSQ